MPTRPVLETQSAEVIVPATLLRSTVQSFDLFDTLVARRCVGPHEIFAEVGAAHGKRDFVAARIAAEQRCFAAGIFDLDAIYAMLVHLGYCTVEDAERLRQSEINAEFDNAIPIVENLMQVQDFDIIVSDMYLSERILRSLLQHVGLRRPVHLFVSNDGKARDRVWAELGCRWLLTRHMGDNPHSDFHLPRSHGIPVSHYTGATINATERYLADLGWQTTARLVRELRLRNPYPAGSLENSAWNHFTALNLPLLILATCILVDERRSRGLEKILLVGRDCHWLAELAVHLYPGEPIGHIPVSRQALKNDTPGALACWASSHLAKSLVADLVSTGHSWLDFHRRTTVPLNLFTLLYIDNYQYAAFDPADIFRTDGFTLSFAITASTTTPQSRGLEVFNTAPHGTPLGIDVLGGHCAPRYSSHHELPAGFVAALGHAQAAIITALRPVRNQVVAETSVLEDKPAILRTLVQSICAPNWVQQLSQAI
ncbi:MAG: hypothetical protein Q8O25_02995 [Sulfurisoma sp.]|nr:hypothetical protein [Sulfurisoma sp.]